MMLHEVGLIPILLVLAAFITPIFSLFTRNRYFYSTYMLIVAIIITLFSYKTIDAVMRGHILVYPFGGWPPPLGIVYTVDFMNGILGFLASILFLKISIYSFWYYGKVAGYEWLTTLMLLLMAGVMGCIYTGDIFNFFVMLEVLCISSYALVSFFKRRRWAVEASISYAFIGALATTFFLFGVSFIYAAYGTLNIADIAAKAQGIVPDTISSWSGVCVGDVCFGNIVLASAVSIALTLWALTFEAGLFPNNYWLPSAYTEAPTPASALFAGIVDKVGTYGVLRIMLTIFSGGSMLMFKVFEIPFRDLVLMILSMLGIVSGYLGSLVMVIQRDVKRFLSYSTISHIGLLFIPFIGFTSNHPEEIMAKTLAAILFHSIVHALSESMLFTGFGTLATIAGSRKIDDMRGYGRRYPAIALAVTIGMLSLLGLAPLPGFFSKYMIFLPMIEASAYIQALSIIIISGISAIGYFRVIYTLFLPKLEDSKKSEYGIVLPSILCISVALILLILGLTYITYDIYSILVSGSKMVVSTNGIRKYIMTVDSIYLKLFTAGGG
ncbi:MAG: proton-conducting transporter membrane subunit [Ignisphaera sp.]